MAKTTAATNKTANVMITAIPSVPILILSRNVLPKTLIIIWLVRESAGEFCALLTSAAEGVGIAVDWAYTCPTETTAKNTTSLKLSVNLFGLMFGSCNPAPDAKNQWRYSDEKYLRYFRFKKRMHLWLQHRQKCRFARTAAPQRIVVARARHAFKKYIPESISKASSMFWISRGAQ